MKVKDLIDILQTYDKNLNVDMLVKVYNKGELIQETLEEIRNIIYTCNLNGDECDSLAFEIIVNEE